MSLKTWYRGMGRIPLQPRFISFLLNFDTAYSFTGHCSKWFICKVKIYYLKPLQSDVSFNLLSWLQRKYLLTLLVFFSTYIIVMDEITTIVSRYKSIVVSSSYKFKLELLTSRLKGLSSVTDWLRWSDAWPILCYTVLSLCYALGCVCRGGGG